MIYSSFSPRFKWEKKKVRASFEINGHNIMWGDKGSHTMIDSSGSVHRPSGDKFKSEAYFRNTIMNIWVEDRK